ncbi:MAG: DNA polymerase I [Dehalococcoidia bacterium]|nr:DNA polymerase I [Dehalococcoidia bacterium]
MHVENKDLLLLIDGNALIHRAFHALPPLTTSRTGEMVNAVYGFTNTLLRVVADFKPTHWAIAFDYPAPTFRHKKFDQYKAHRPPTPEELRSQIRRLHDLVIALGMPLFEVEGYEADDILGTLATQARDLNAEADILTGDRDLLQMAGPGISILLPGRNFSEAIPYDSTAVEARFGVSPDQFSAYKALVGDPSDNIPGVTGIGDKTASRLIAQFKNLNGIYEHLSEVTPARLQAVLASSRAQAELSQYLATIVVDAPVKLSLHDCAIGDYDREEVLSLFQELEFTSLLPRLPQNTPAGIPLPPTPPAVTQSEVRVIADDGDRALLTKTLSQTTDMVLSVVLNGKGRPNRKSRSDGLLESEPQGLGISPGSDGTFYLPVEPLPSGPADQLMLERPLDFLSPTLENEGSAKMCEDAKVIMHYLARHGIALKGLDFDISVAAHLAGEKNVSLQAVALTRLGLSLSDAPEPREGLTVEASDIAHWLALRSNACRDVREALESDLKAKDLCGLYRNVELPLISVLAAMEEYGILIDGSILHEMSRTLTQELHTLEASIYDAAGHQFNINSPKQLGNVLFDELGLPGGRKTKGGYSTEASLLETIRSANPIIDLILQYRQLAKLKSTYVDTLPALINPRTGRVHTVFSQTGTTTGRLSSSDPNLQNLPVKTEAGRMIRSAVVAPKGSTLLSADYSQIDLRALAHLSQDKDLMAAFAHDEDIHRITASKVFNVRPEDVTPAMRSAAKVVNFGVVYGMSDYGLERATEFTRAEASTFIKTYFQKYPGVSRWIENTKKSARETGYVQTLLGRRRYILELNSPNRQIRESAERMAVNAPVQGTSADIIKVAMIEIHKTMQAEGLRSRMLLQIHDELLFEVVEGEMSRIVELAQTVMPNAVKLTVPLKVDLKAGPNWADLKPVS